MQKDDENESLDERCRRAREMIKHFNARIDAGEAPDYEALRGLPGARRRDGSITPTNPA